MFISATLGKKCSQQTHLFTPNHEKYHLIINLNDKILRTTYQFNPKHSTFDEKDAIRCIVSDAISGSMTLKEWQSEFGCDNTQRTRQLYERCRKFLSFFNQNGVSYEGLYSILDDLEN